MATLESRSEYVLALLSMNKRSGETVGQTLAGWAIVSAATTPEEVEARRVLHETYLVSYVLIQSHFKASLVK